MYIYIYIIELSRNSYVYISLSVYRYQRFQFFCLINCLPFNKQFRTFHLGVRYTVFSFNYKPGISLIFSTLFWVFCFVVLLSNIPWIIPYRFYDVVL